MKKLFMCLLLSSFIFGGLTFAHPGNTASDGCHYCRTRCDYRGVAWNQRHCHGGSSSSYDYTPTKSYDTCPENSLLINGSCECFMGYKPGIGNTTCIKDMEYDCKQKGMIYDSTTSSCTCKYGESLNSYSQKCVINDIGCQKEYGVNSKSDYGICSCKDGYKMNDDSYCVKKKGIGWYILGISGIGLYLYNRNKSKT